MRRLVVSESVTLDGVFEAETMSQWAAPYYSDERDALVREVVLASDALILGRTTYDLQAWYWPNQQEDKYGLANHKNRMAKYVVTSRPLQAQWNNSTIIAENVVAEVAKLKRQPGRDILVEGSATLVEELGRAGLVDEYKIFVHPAVMGSGRRLFKESLGLTKLKLIESRPIRLGVVLLNYAPAP